jgi:hypothetical protein
MTEAKHTPGPWFVTGNRRLYVDARIGGGWVQEVAACGPTHQDGGYGDQQRANARLICAAPELKAVADNFQINGPDEDGFIWLVLHGNGTTGKAMFNLGNADGIAWQVALLLEEDRRAAIAKATGN